MRVSLLIALNKEAADDCGNNTYRSKYERENSALCAKRYNTECNR